MRKLQFLFLLTCFGFISLVYAQETSTTVDGFLKRLQSLSYGNEGTVHIYQDGRVVEKMRSRLHAADSGTEKPYRSSTGYRIQVFSSNVPRTAKNQAFGVESEIKSELDTPVYVNFAAPFWKVRVGDCRTYQEAVTLLNQLKSQFPGRKNMMYIVRDNIRIYAY